MALRDTEYGGRLAHLPEDTNAQLNYFELVQIWEILCSSGNPTQDSLEAMMLQARQLMSSRELAFFNAPLPSELVGYPNLLQSKVAGRLSKILMDRHGFKIPHADGGLGD